MSGIEINPQFEQVLDFVNHTNQPVFLTGKAGTGKTTLLKCIRQNTFKQMAVVAPTGVAAINAGGSTIHSFFQFPFAPFLPMLNEAGELDYSKTNLPTLKYNAQRLAIFRNLELLVIDEISMVRADLLDQVDVTLRQTRRKWQQAFGGVQVLLIGDMHQLPPVVQPDEWSLLNRYYQSPYFFESMAVRSNPPVYIELEKIYRQSDSRFIQLLNKVRNNQLDQRDLDELNERHRADLREEDYRNNITLTTHNKKADEINARNLANLPGEPFRFRCKTDGIFSDKNYPADEELVIKLGTRVMFLKNNAEKNYYNGKIGIVSFVDSKTIRVRCEEDMSEIEVGQEAWTNVAYSLDKSTKHVQEEILGTFVQYPLRYAWAITIHKSQGLTFDKLIIDAAESFSAGQVYVALSRCRSLDGLTLSSRINQRSLANDQAILSFAASRPTAKQVGAIYQNARHSYLNALLLGLFDFSEPLNARRDIGGIIQLHRTRLNTEGLSWAETFFSGIEALNEVAVKFRNQLQNLLNATKDVESDAVLQERIKKASVYFDVEIGKLLDCVKTCSLVTESKMAADELAPELQQLFETLFARRRMIAACGKGFVFADFIREKMSVNYPDFRLRIYANAGNVKVGAGVQHPQLYRQLLLLRDDLCNDEQKAIYMVAGNKSLAELANFLPAEPEHLLLISGFGQAKVDAYGEQFLAIIKTYMAEHGLTSNMHLKAPKKTKKKEKNMSGPERGEDAPEKAMKKAGTREQTFALFKQGHQPADIARQRGLSLGTIEGHLVPYVASGELQVNDLVEPRKQALILSALEDFDYQTGLNPVKNKLPADISFSEIKFVLAAKIARSGA